MGNETVKSENIIELRHVMRQYDDNGFIAVHDFNLEVKRGEFVTFLGPSGCGKTTTLRMIAGFDIPTSGEILLNGKSITAPRHMSVRSIRFSSAMRFFHT